MTATRLYVVMTEAAAQGPKIGAKRIEWAVEVPDKSGTSYEYARREAVRAYADSLGVTEARIYVFGIF